MVVAVETLRVWHKKAQVLSKKILIYIIPFLAQKITVAVIAVAVVGETLPKYLLS